MLLLLRLLSKKSEMVSHPNLIAVFVLVYFVYYNHFSSESIMYAKVISNNQIFLITKPNHSQIRQMLTKFTTINREYNQCDPNPEGQQPSIK